MDFKDQIRNEIAKGNTEKALFILRELSKSGRVDLADETVILQSRFKKWQKEKNLGIITNDAELRKIEYSILELMKDEIFAGHEIPLKNSEPKKEKESEFHAHIEVAVPNNISFGHEILLFPTMEELGLSRYLTSLGIFQTPVKIGDWVNRGEELLRITFKIYKKREKTSWFSFSRDTVIEEGIIFPSPVSGLLIGSRKEISAPYPYHDLTPISIYYEGYPILPILLIPNEEPPQEVYTEGIYGITLFEVLKNIISQNRDNLLFTYVDGRQMPLNKALDELVNQSNANYFNIDVKEGLKINEYLIRQIPPPKTFKDSYLDIPGYDSTTSIEERARLFDVYRNRLSEEEQNLWQEKLHEEYVERNRWREKYSNRLQSRDGIRENEIIKNVQNLRAHNLDLRDKLLHLVKERQD